MAADGTNSAFALSFSFCFWGRNTIGLQFLYLAFRTIIKLWWSADGTSLPATFAIPVRWWSCYHVSITVNCLEKFQVNDFVYVAQLANFAAWDTTLQER